MSLKYLSKTVAFILRHHPEQYGITLDEHGWAKEEVTPPEILYHGTGEKSVASINEQGLLTGRRLYVHLSPDAETAVKVGSRHGTPYVYRVATGKDFFMNLLNFTNAESFRQWRW